jgi:hypothetical protein
MAQVWNEEGDAGDLPATAQVPLGTGPLTAILGTLQSDTDADMYCISVPETGRFLGTTCFVTSFDTQLWLFDQTGLGLSFNDDDPGGCGLQSAVTGVFLPGPGEYLIAITSYSNDALNAAGQEIWADSPFGVERQPDGDGAGDPYIVSWNGGGFSDGAYQIDLTGAEYCGGATPVEPTTWGNIKTLYR